MAEGARVDARGTVQRGVSRGEAVQGDIWDRGGRTVKPNYSLIEEGVMRYPTCGTHGIANLRRYRIEIGHECGCPEGIIWLPIEVDSEAVEAFLDLLCRVDEVK